MATKKRILLIEDESAVRESLRAFLEESDYEVAEAENGRQGEKEILLAKPDLVILDLNLPGRSGEEVLKFIKSHKPTRNIPIIVLTGAGTLSKKISCMLKGAAGFLHKPYDNIELLKTIKRYL